MNGPKVGPMVRFVGQYHERPGNEGGCQTTFTIDPIIDLNAAALLDMISPEPTVSEKTTPTERPSKPANLERKISVAQAFMI